MIKSILLLFLVGIVCFLRCDALQILSIMSTPSPSHHIFNRVLNLELVKRGHHVTVISADPEKHPPPKNYRHFVIENLYHGQDEFDYESLNALSIFERNQLYFDWVNFICSQIVKSSTIRQVRDLAKNETFDLILFEMTLQECSLGLVSDFNHPPIIGISAFGFAPWISWLSGLSEDPQYLPHYRAEYLHPLTFWQKLETHFFNWYTLFYYRRTHLPRMTHYANELFGTNVNLEEIVKNTSLFLINTNLARDIPRPASPDLISIGGMHINEGNPLPKDLQKWMDESKEGVIFFSLGSNLRSDKLSEEIKDIFINTFSKLKERILFKFESDLPEIPKNAKISKWLPQRDILGHPNMRLFISHGGAMSTNEALYHGVPLVIIPFFADQMTNAETLQNKGISLRIDIKELFKEKDKLYNSIRRVIDEPRFKENALKLQAIYKDEPLKPLDKAIFWIEYVARHQGAKHLRLNSRELTWYELAHLDIFAFYLIVFLTIIISIKLVKKCFKSNKKIDLKKKKL